MIAYKTIATLSKDHSVTLEALPFSAGEQVEVILLARTPGNGEPTFPLRGRPVKYVNPTDPVGEKD
ncbi:MAG: hypothetical protein FLDDKLPJ_01600 [Phycisphaerae bacterium]|nr:hypothetical protein [Phycisphaerae bacterium]